MCWSGPRVRVKDGLPEALRQGLAACTVDHGAIVRFSTNPGDVLSDPHTAWP